MRAGGGLLLGVAGLAAWQPIGAAVRAHPYFAVREVIVRGNRRLAPDAVRRRAGIEPGISVWEVDHRRAEAMLEEEPWIRWARVRRHLPHRVTIRVREERPAAILATASTLYYVARPDRVIAKVAPGDARDFPYLTGLSPADLEEPGGARAIRQSLRLLRLAAKTGPVSEVHVDRGRGLTVLPVVPALPIEVGWTRFADKLARLGTVLADWAGREAEVAGISLLFDDEVIVRTRAAKKSGPVRPAART